MDHASLLAIYENPECTPACPEAPDDAALVAAAQRDAAAFGALYQRYLARVYRYLRLRTPSPEDAADLTQQVFLQALDALPRYQQRGLPFAAWLFRIAHNLASNAGQRRRDQQTVDWDVIAGTLERQRTRDATGDSDPEAALLRREALARLCGLLKELDPAKRDLLAMRFVVGLTVREIALVVGKSEAAVHKQFARTLQTLKEQYHEA